MHGPSPLDRLLHRRRVLARVGGAEPAYELKGGETYVRARVRDSMGFVAWVQPVFTDQARF
jgi:hypothetical protein